MSTEKMNEDGQVRKGLGWTIPITDPEVRRRALEFAESPFIPSGYGPMGCEETDAERDEWRHVRAGWLASQPKRRSA